MALENVNSHTHDSGFGRWDWKYYTDATVDLATQKLNAVAHDGISADELNEFLTSANDFGQINAREARQLSSEIRKHYDQLSPEARKIAEKFEAKFQGLVENLHDDSDEAFAENPHNWLGRPEPRNTPITPDAVVLEGEELNAFSNEINQLAHPRPQFVNAYPVDPNLFDKLQTFFPLRG